MLEMCHQYWEPQLEVISGVDAGDCGLSLLCAPFDTATRHGGCVYPVTRKQNCEKDKEDDYLKSRLNIMNDLD